MVEINIQAESDYQLIEVRGEVDASSSIELDNALKSAAENYAKILINLSKLEYISSAGLGVFISYLEELKTNDIKLVIFGLQEKVREVFDILGLQHLMNITNNKEEAQALLNGK
ncbi:STAS domain-containing protein [Marinoscillum sp. 108]|uniref:STAS domain-containing protein n=1 Tax=Marinoscillum sp. 108 TaxID=2653151 RepID=UPI0012F1FB98|nr:STAS domain-containing protein [Marinoscillum sp. 108]VXD19128.1 Anti-sigma factor antagonist [Marinoscillum sp. 108]